jgi:hypothetical protein
MKSILSVLLVLTILISGCGQALRVDFDPQRFDRLTVVSVETEMGNSSGLVLPDGSLVTCSHAFVRRSHTGDMILAGHYARYEVVASGDDLEQEWGRWSREQAPPVAKDWAIATPVPGVPVAEVFVTPEFPRVSAVPPQLGETLYLVAYTKEDEVFTRYWTPVQVVSKPWRYSDPGAGAFWVKVVDGSSLRRGFSGAPLLRLSGDDHWEVCGILVDAEVSLDKGPHAPHHTDLGVAITFPVVD